MHVFTLKNYSSPCMLIITVILAGAFAQSSHCLAKQMTRTSMVRTAATKVAKTIAQPISWISQTRLYKKHPWMVKAAGAVVLGLAAKKGYDFYRKRKSLPKRNQPLPPPSVRKNTFFAYKHEVNSAHITDAWRKKHNNRYLSYTVNRYRDEIHCDRLPQCRCMTDLDKEIQTTPLMIAAEEGNLATLQHLIRNGVNINAQDTGGHTALFYAVEENRLQIIQELIKAGADVNIQNHNGLTILHDVAAYDDSEENILIINELIKAGAQLEIETLYRNRIHEETALICAADCNNYKVISTLMNAGSSVNANIIDQIVISKLDRDGEDEDDEFIKLTDDWTNSLKEAGLIPRNDLDYYSWSKDPEHNIPQCPEHIQNYVRMHPLWQHINKIQKSMHDEAHIAALQSDDKPMRIVAEYLF